MASVFGTKNYRYNFRCTCVPSNPKGINQN